MITVLPASSPSLASPGEEPPGPCCDLSRSQTEAFVLRELSDRLLAAQRPLRLLEALRWPDEAETAFFASDCRKLPEVAYSPLPFEPAAKQEELRRLLAEVERR